MYAVVLYAHSELNVAVYGPYRSKAKAEEIEALLTDPNSVEYFDPEWFNSAVVQMSKAE